MHEGLTQVRLFFCQNLAAILNKGCGFFREKEKKGGRKKRTRIDPFTA